MHLLLDDTLLKAFHSYNGEGKEEYEAFREQVEEHEQRAEMMEGEEGDTQKEELAKRYGRLERKAKEAFERVREMMEGVTHREEEAMAQRREEEQEIKGWPFKHKIHHELKALEERTEQVERERGLDYCGQFKQVKRSLLKAVEQCSFEDVEAKGMAELKAAQKIQELKSALKAEMESLQKQEGEIPV